MHQPSLPSFLRVVSYDDAKGSLRNDKKDKGLEVSECTWLKHKLYCAVTLQRINDKYLPLLAECTGSHSQCQTSFHKKASPLLYVTNSKLVFINLYGLINMVV